MGSSFDFLKTKLQAANPLLGNFGYKGTHCKKLQLFFVLQSNFIHLPQHIALTILHFIGQIFISWLALTLPATAQTTAKADLPFYQIQQLDQSAVLPFWKESATSVWSYLSESLEESAAENEEDNEEGDTAAKQQFLHAATAHHNTAKRRNGAYLHAKVPLYLRYCSLKIDQV